MLPHNYVIISGKEFRALVLSTTEPINSDGSSKNPLHSFTDRFIFNTAISRAQSLVVAVGNPIRLLKMEEHMVRKYGEKGKCWSNYIKRSLDNGAFHFDASLNLSHVQEKTYKMQLGKLLQSSSKAIASLDPAPKPSFDSVRKPSLKPAPKPSLDPVHEPSLDSVHKPSLDSVHKPSLDPKLSLDSVHKLSLDPKLSLDSVHKPSLDPTPKPSLDSVNKPSLDPVHESSLDSVHKPSLEPAPKPSLDPVHEPSLDSVYKPSLDPVHEPSLDSVHKPSLDPVHEPSLDSVYKPSLDPTLKPSLDPAPKLSPAPKPAPKPNLQNVNSRSILNAMYTRKIISKPEFTYTSLDGGYACKVTFTELETTNKFAAENKIPASKTKSKENAATKALGKVTNCKYLA